MYLSAILGSLALANANSLLYLGSVEQLSWDNALARCESFGGKLATFGSAGEFDAVLSVTNELSSRNGFEAKAWIGFNDRNTENHWGFIDGDTSFCQATGTGTDCDDIPQWNPGEPSQQGDEDCGEIWPWAGTINDESCNSSRSFVCELNGDNVAVAEQGGALYVARGDESVNYATAKARCVGMGGQLATFSDGAQFEAILDSVKGAMPSSTPWIGMDDLNLEHHWEFVDKDFSYCQPQGPGTDCDDIDQWAPGEPNNAGNEDCAHVWPGSNAINDAPCGNSYPYVCEFASTSMAWTDNIPATVPKTLFEISLSDDYNVGIDEVTTEVFDGEEIQIGWVKTIACDEGAPFSFEHASIASLAADAFSVKIVPAGSTANSAYDDFAVVAKPGSGAVQALNNFHELSTHRDLVGANWVGSGAALNRLWNTCAPSFGSGRDFGGRVYHACNNVQGIHITPGKCEWDWRNNLGQDMEIYFGYPMSDLSFSAAGSMQHSAAAKSIPMHLSEAVQQPGDTVVVVTVPQSAFELFVFAVVAISAVLCVAWCFRGACRKQVRYAKVAYASEAETEENAAINGV